LLSLSSNARNPFAFKHEDFSAEQVIAEGIIHDTNRAFVITHNGDVIVQDARKK
jgi:hypothetical protein